MSKVGQAKDEQGYVDRGPTCGKCAMFESKFVLPAWIQEAEVRKAEQGILPSIWSDSYRIEKNLRCGLGGFKVKKMGCCDSFTVK